eukprot:533704-Amphidinium_carterae.1
MSGTSKHSGRLKSSSNAAQTESRTPTTPRFDEVECRLTHGLNCVVLFLRLWSLLSLEVGFSTSQ